MSTLTPAEAEAVRRDMLVEVNTSPTPPDAMTKDQMQELYVVEQFAAPFVVVKRKSDGVRGTLEFKHMPRFYFNFQPTS